MPPQRALRAPVRVALLLLLATLASLGDGSSVKVRPRKILLLKRDMGLLWEAWGREE